MEFSKWITSGLKQPGKKAAELARLLGISPDKISKMKKGEREPKYGEIPIIEDDLGIKFSSRRTGRAAKPTARIPMPIPIIGIAEATAFRPASEFDAGDESSLATLLAPRSLLYPTARHFAMEVRGDSMNAAKDSPIPNGSFVLCIDIGSAGIIVESGRVDICIGCDRRRKSRQARCVNNQRAARRERAVRTGRRYRRNPLCCSQRWIDFSNHPG